MSRSHDTKVPWRPTVPDCVKDIVPANTALLVVDMTYYSAHPEYGLCAEYRAAGHGDALQYYVDGLVRITPRVAALVAAARAARMEVLFTRVQSGTPDGRDRSVHQGHLGLHVPPGSKGAEIVEAVGATQDDLLITKASWGSFYGTNLDAALRNFRIETLLVCGVTTDGCVEATVREAADRGYRVALIEDACTTSSSSAHTAALAAVGSRHTFVTSSAYALETLEALARKAASAERARVTSG